MSEHESLSTWMDSIANYTHIGADGILFSDSCSAMWINALWAAIICVCVCVILYGNDLNGASEIVEDKSYGYCANGPFMD